MQEFANFANPAMAAKIAVLPINIVVMLMPGTMCCQSVLICSIVAVYEHCV